MGLDYDELARALDKMHDRPHPPEDVPPAAKAPPTPPLSLGGRLAVMAATAVAFVGGLAAPLLPAAFAVQLVLTVRIGGGL